MRVKYSTMVFGHRKCFGGYRVLIGSAEEVPGTPGKRYGPYRAKRGNAPATRGRRKEGRERKVWSRTPPSFPLPPLSFPLGKTWQGAQGKAGPVGDIIVSAVCGPPSIVYSLGHIFVVLRRSPAEITSPSPSPRRRAIGTHLLPRRLTGSRRWRTSPN